VQWWVPGESNKANQKAGPKRSVIDMFGSWQPADEVLLAALVPLPKPEIKRADVLEWGFDLTNANELPFETLDNIMDQHKIDITGLTLTNTPRGNKYRTYRLLLRR